MIEFTPEFNIGVPEIDKQHKELVNHINEALELGMGAVSKAETEKTLNFLGDYVVKHFKDEEAISREYVYPKFQSHKKQHDDFIAEFVKLKEEYHNNGASMLFTRTLNVTVIEWVTNHIKNDDMELGKYIRRNWDKRAKKNAGNG